MGARFYQAGRLDSPRRPPKCPEPLCPTRALPPLGCARACFFHGVIGLPQRKSGSASRSIPLETTSCGGTFEVTDISLCSGLQVCSPPRSSLPLRILPQGGRGFYVRAERGSLPPRASDMLTARRQAIGGTGTCTPLDCGLVGCSFPLAAPSREMLHELAIRRSSGVSRIEPQVNMWSESASFSREGSTSPIALSASARRQARRERRKWTANSRRTGQHADLLRAESFREIMPTPSSVLPPPGRLPRPVGMIQTSA